MFRQITKFNQIPIIPNSLIVLDIDETIIKFNNINRNWWITNTNRHFINTKNYYVADQLSFRDWITYVTNTNPTLVDDKINSWIKDSKADNCDLILLTARKKFLKYITLLHLNSVNLNFNKELIFFNENKGDALLNITKNLYSNKKNSFFLCFRI